MLGGTARESSLKIEPTILDGVSPDDAVMQEEIFGPILPVLTFESLDEAETFITDRPTPLALYIFSQDRAVQERFVRHVPFGGGWPEALAAKYGIERRELNELLAESDIVCVHCPLDETTAGFIGKAELALMKPSALLVNMARGGIVDEDALYEALRGKVISGAIIDAYSQEPLTASPLFSLDNVILSPHAGAFTTDALNAMSRMSVDQLFQYVDGATPDNLVTAE